MIALFFEGLAASVHPDSLALAVPALAVALVSRTESTAGLIGFAASLIGYSWLRFTERGEPLPRLTIAGLLAVGMVVLVLPVIRRLDAVSALGGFLIGIASTELWKPDAGGEFGLVLEQLAARGTVASALLVLYLVAVMAPMIAAGVLLHHLPDVITVAVRPAMLAVGVAVLTVLSLAVAVGRHDQVLAQLARLTPS